MKFFTVLIVLSIVSIAFAEQFPQPVGFVNDFANVLGADQRVQLDAMLAVVERNTTAEIAVVTVDNASDPFTYSVDLFEAWGIGKKSNDNGVLVLYAKTQNRIEVRTGYGVEGILPDAKVGRILDEYYVPLRDANRTAEGIVAATLGIVDVIRANADEIRAGTAGLDVFGVLSSTIWSNFSFVIFAVLILSLLAFRMAVPKCPNDGKRMRVESREWSDGYEIVHYVCPVCGRVVKKKRSRSSFFIAGGFGGGGFGGGGFGGGGTGGGGAGR